MSPSNAKEYWIASWIKYALLGNFLIGFLGLSFIVGSYFYSDFGLFLLGVLFFIYGIVFFAAFKSCINNPIFKLYDDALVCMGFFGKQKTFSPLCDFEIIIHFNDVISLEKDGIRSNINSHLLGSKGAKSLFNKLITYDRYLGSE